MLSFECCLGLGLCAVAAVTDLLHHRIPNWLLGGASIVSGTWWLIQATTVGVSQLWTPLVGALVCALPASLLYAAGGAAGGDFKLLVVLGAMVGAISGLRVTFIALALTGAGAAVVAALEKRLLHFLTTICHLLRALCSPLGKLSAEKRTLVQLPFAPFVCAGMAVECVVHITCSL